MLALLFIFQSLLFHFLLPFPFLRIHLGFRGGGRGEGGFQVAGDCSQGVGSVLGVVKDLLYSFSFLNSTVYECMGAWVYECMHVYY